MSNTIPLPEPDHTTSVKFGCDGLWYRSDQMRYYAAAVSAAGNAALRETLDAAKTVGVRQEGIIMEQERRIKVLEDALQFYASPGDYKAPYTGGMGKLYFDCGTTARAALGDKNG